MNRRRGATFEIVQQSKRLLIEHGLMTLRHLYYLLISAGTIINSTKSYPALVRIISDARRRREIPYSSLVDGTRSTVKPSSWSGLADFSDTVRDAYRKDLWQQQRQYIEFWCEKDAIVGVIEEVTREYDVMVRPLRGYSSLTFIHHAACDLRQIEKPITIYYLGDHDPSGYDIERASRESLSSMLPNKPILTADVLDAEAMMGLTFSDVFVGARRFIRWSRLAIAKGDIKTYGLLPFPAKKHDTRYKAFVREYGTEAVELDALPPDVLRSRVRQTIESHIDMRAWRKLQEIEKAELESLGQVMSGWKKA